MKCENNWLNVTGHATTDTKYLDWLYHRVKGKRKGNKQEEQEEEEDQEEQEEQEKQEEEE